MMYLKQQHAVVLFGMFALVSAMTLAERRIGIAANRFVQPVTIADSIGMTDINDLNSSLGPVTNIATFSPNGRKFVIVTHKGNLRDNTNDYSLLLFKSSDIFRLPRPDLLLTLASSSNDPGISNLQWLADNETMIFLGERPGKTRQLYSFNIYTHALRQLTHSKTDLLAYSTSKNGEKIAFTAKEPAISFWNEKTRRHGLELNPTDSWVDALIADQPPQLPSGPIRLSVLIHNHTGYVTKNLAQEIHAWPDTPLSMSPNGKYIVLQTQVESIPGIWKNYTNKAIISFIEAAPTNVTRYEVIDTDNGTNWILINAPQDEYSSIAWSPNSRYVAVTNTALPLTKTIPSEEYQVLAATLFIVQVDVTNNTLTKISEQEFKNDYLPSNSELAHEPEVMVMEDMNTPPKVIAVDRQTRRRVVLLDLNPQFKYLKFAQEIEIHWRGTDGREVRGGLYYPVNYVSGKRYPFVIQTHGFYPDRFWIDGPSNSGFAAQALAGKGIMVLQSEIAGVSQFETIKETQANVAMFEGAIDYLDRKGFIDRNRVGIIGWSRTSAEVAYALVNSKYHFAAAVFPDSVDDNYLFYLFDNIYRSITEKEYGAAPFGFGLKSWLKLSPSFHLDKVHTPIRVVATNPWSLLFEWDWFVGLTRLGKPVDMVLLQGGAHNLQRPWERMVSQGGNVDWFCFWLQGNEDPDPAKRAQYKRWEALRKLQEANEAQATTTTR